MSSRLELHKWQGRRIETIHMWEVYVESLYGQWVSSIPIRVDSISLALKLWRCSGDVWCNTCSLIETYFREADGFLDWSPLWPLLVTMIQVVSTLQISSQGRLTHDNQIHRRLMYKTKASALTNSFWPASISLESSEPEWGNLVVHLGSWNSWVRILYAFIACIRNFWSQVPQFLSEAGSFYYRLLHKKGHIFSAVWMTPPQIPCRPPPFCYTFVLHTRNNVTNYALILMLTCLFHMIFWLLWWEECPQASHICRCSLESTLRCLVSFLTW